MAISGANISTGLGTGAAQVWHWEDLHNTVNNLIQQDIKRKQELKNEYEKSSLMAAQAQQGLRPADVALFKEDYDKYKTADLMLMNPKVQNNQKEFQYWTDQKMSSYSNMLQTQAESKKSAANYQSIMEQNYKEGGVNAKDDFAQKMANYNNLNHKQLTESGYLLPTNYFYDKGRITDEVFNTRLRGTEKKQDVLIPDASGKTQTYEYTHPSVVSLQTENGKPIMSSVTGKVKLNYQPLINEYTQGLKEVGGRSIHDLKSDYIQQEPNAVKDTFIKANKYLQDSGEQTIPQTPEYFKLAQRIVQATDETQSFLKKEAYTETPEQKLSTKLFLMKKQNEYAVNRLKESGKIRSEELGEAVKQSLDNLDNSFNINVNVDGKSEVAAEASPDLLKENGRYEMIKGKRTYVTPELISKDESGNYKALFPKKYKERTVDANGKVHLIGDPIEGEYEGKNIQKSDIATHYAKKIGTEQKGGAILDVNKSPKKDEFGSKTSSSIGGYVPKVR